MPKESNPRSSPRRRPPTGKKTVRRPAPAPKKKKLKRVHRTIRPEFKPDKLGSSPLKALVFTRMQRLHLLRWISYVGVCLLSLVIQDTIMSRVSIFGATTDLTVGAMLLITVIEGTENGSVFILLASCIYYFSGSSPGPFCVALLTIYGVLMSMLRQIAWHRSRSSIILCAGLALFVYEISLFVLGVFQGLTNWHWAYRFLITAVLSLGAMFPQYSLIYRFGQIGGYVWKE